MRHKGAHTEINKKSTIHIQDIIFVKKEEQYSLSELAREDIDELYYVLQKSCEEISSYSRITLIFPNSDNIYRIGQLSIQQLSMLKHFFKRIHTGQILQETSGVIREIIFEPKETVIIETMAKNNMSVIDTARQLDIDRNTVYKNIRTIQDKTGYNIQNFYHLGIVLSALQANSILPAAKEKGFLVQRPLPIK